MTLKHDTTGEEKQLVRWIEAGSGYASQSDAIAHFGLGEAQSILRIEITWPSGYQERIEQDSLKDAVNKEWVITESEGLQLLAR